MYRPVFEGPIMGYAAGSIQRHLWKVGPLFDRDDMMQEAYLVFLRCASSYPVLDTPQHFMSLFKTAWSRHIIDLAKKHTKTRVIVSANMVDEDDGHEWQREPVGDLDNAGYLLTMLRQAPAEVRQVLNLFLNAPAELIDMAMSAWQETAGIAPDPNAFICRALGLPKGTKPIETVREYLR